MNYVYILTDKNNKTMYIGVTNNLFRRVYEHREGLVEGFTKKYHVHKLVYYECIDDIRVAIGREKQLKGWRREKKDELVETLNKNWDDLWGEISE